MKMKKLLLMVVGGLMSLTAMTAQAQVDFKLYFANNIGDVARVSRISANDGGCLTLGLNKSGKVGFFIYKGRNKIPAFRSYISTNKVSDAQELLLEDETTGISVMEKCRNAEHEKCYNLKGQRLHDPAKGINAVKGRLFIKK